MGQQVTKAVSFYTSDEAETVKEAIRSVRSERDRSMREGKAVAKACEEYLRKGGENA